MKSDRPDENIVKVIVNLSEPKNKKELQRILRIICEVSYQICQPWLPRLGNCLKIMLHGFGRRNKLMLRIKSKKLSVLLLFWSILMKNYQSVCKQIAFKMAVVHYKMGNLSRLLQER